MPYTGRPGGNPDLKKHQFKASGEESNNQHLQLMIPESMKSKLKTVPNWQQFVREAIARALSEE